MSVDLDETDEGWKREYMASLAWYGDKLRQSKIEGALLLGPLNCDFKTPNSMFFPAGETSVTRHCGEENRRYRRGKPRACRSSTGTYPGSLHACFSTYDLID